VAPRHHLLTKSLGKILCETKQQKAATDLPQFAAFDEEKLAAICR
jgi:hypothetical protein